MWAAVGPPIRCDAAESWPERSSQPPAAIQAAALHASTALFPRDCRPVTGVLQGSSGEHEDHPVVAGG